ncbi:MAG TPA: cytochrome D1 domain-containing protein [Anaerolineae bacterium]|nr:cytochrome D1 domain-containing protein [Anaerolineae bacterium]
MHVNFRIPFFLILVALAALLAGCGGAEPTDAPAAEPTSEVVEVSAVTEATASIVEGAFQPHTLVVATGATITWQNDDTVAHTVTSQDGWFDSGQIEPGETFTYQFDQPGTFQYQCNNHGTMEGVVVVLSGGVVSPALFEGQPVEQAFRDSCSGCHGPNREGATGPALIPGRLEAGDDYYFDIIKNGKPGTVMPAWGPVGMSDEEIWALVGYIHHEPSAESVQWDLDQIAASREVLVDEATLPDEPAHEGNVDNLMLVTEREARSIAVFDGDTHTLLGHIEASYRAHGYAFDPTNERWAWNVGRDGWLFKIDLYTLQAVSKVRVGLDARGLAISDDGKYAIVGNFIPNSAVIVDAQTLEPLKVFTTEGNNPQGEFVSSRVCITSDVAPEKVGPYFILALKEAGQMWRIDYSQPDFPVDKLEGVGNILHDGFLSPDNRYFYIASQQDDWMAVIDVASWELVAQIPTGITPHPGSGAAWEANGTVYGATVHGGEGKITVWDLGNNEIVAEIETSGPGLFIRSHHDSPYVWADTMFGSPPNRIYVFDSATFEVVKVIDEGVQTLHPEFTHDGKFVYVADWQGEVVRVYDAATFEKVAEVGGVSTPTGIFNTSRRSETLGH